MAADSRKHILIIRFSALGDVAILAPVLKQKMAASPDVDVTVAAPPMLEPLFSGIPHLSFIGIDKRAGYLRIFRQLLSCRPDIVADIHSVTRTFILDSLFLMHFVPVRIMVKQRIKRRKLLKHKNIQLTPSWQKYDYVLRKCGMAGAAAMPEYFSPKTSQDGVRRIGIAPFSTSIGKDYPLEKMEKVISMLAGEPDVEICLFGGKKYAVQFGKWMAKYPCVRIPDCPSFSEELDLIRKLDVMVSMDSANLHFASALEVPAVTVWGATHPYCGFAGWGQNPEWSVQADLPCRPCSIYGSKPCYKGTYECMGLIDPEQIYEKVMNLISQ